MELKAKLLVSLDTARDSAFGDFYMVASLNSLLHLLVRLLFARRIFCSTVAYHLHRLRAGCSAKPQTARHGNNASLATHKVTLQWPAASVLCLVHAHNALNRSCAQLASCPRWSNADVSLLLTTYRGMCFTCRLSTMASD